MIGTEHAGSVPVRTRVQLGPGGGGVLRVQRAAVGAEVPLQQAQRVPAVSGVFNLPEMATSKNKNFVFNIKINNTRVLIQLRFN